MNCYSDMNESDELDIMEDPASFGGIKRNRSCTDKGFLIGMAIFFVILFGFLGYSISNGDLDRIFNGYDDCGNICGKNNIKDDSIPYECFGKNMEDKKYLLYGTDVENYFTRTKYITRTCVANCAEHNAYVDYLNICYPNSWKKVNNFTTDTLFQELAEDFDLCWKNIILLSFFAFVFSVIMLVLLRYATAFVVWFVLITISMLLIGLTTFLWILFNHSLNDGSQSSDGLLFFSIIVTVFTFIFLLVILVMGKRIKLIIELFKESAKSIADMPLILFQPVLTILSIMFIVFMGLYTMLWISSTGNLETTYSTRDNSKHLDYVMNAVGRITTFYNFVAILWIIQFVVGCQHMIIGGCVATWFFTRNKNNIESPIVKSTSNLLKYHLGTVALGSLIITIVQVIKTIIAYLKSAARNKKNLVLMCIWCFCSYIIQIIEDLLKYFTKNAYIYTSIYGTSFCVSGKRAFNILMNNIFKVIAINSVGDYVLSFIKLFIVILTLFVGAEIFRQNDKLHNLWFPLVILGIITFLIAHCFITVFETAIDTIFLCFCEDCTYNDGLSKPYYMSRNLMEFVEKSNKSMNKSNWTDFEQQAWDNGPKRILSLNQ